MDQEAENDEERISDNEPTLSATTDFDDLQFILQETRVLLLQQILAHPTGVLSVEELVYRNPDLSEKNIRYHLRELENRGIVEGLEIPKGKRERNLPNTFFTVTEKGLQLLKQTNLYEEVGVWTQVYDQMERTPRIKAIERMENRPENQIIKEEQRTTTESQEVRTCPECDSENLVKSSSRGELICDDCGLVVEEGSINPGPE